jgi:hypothetical protein
MVPVDDPEVHAGEGGIPPQIIEHFPGPHAGSYVIALFVAVGIGEVAGQAHPSENLLSHD